MGIGAKQDAMEEEEGNDGRESYLSGLEHEHLDSELIIVEFRQYIEKNPLSEAKLERNDAFVDGPYFGISSDEIFRIGEAKKAFIMYPSANPGSALGSRLTPRLPVERRA